MLSFLQFQNWILVICLRTKDIFVKLEAAKIEMALVPADDEEELGSFDPPPTNREVFTAFVLAK